MIAGTIRNAVNQMQLVNDWEQKKATGDVVKKQEGMTVTSQEESMIQHFREQLERDKAGKGSDCAKSDYLGKGSCTDYRIGAFITCSCSCHDCGSGYSGDSNPLQFSICFIPATT